MKGVDNKGRDLGVLGKRVPYSSIGPGVIWRRYLGGSDVRLELTPKPDIATTHFLVGAPYRSGGTSSAAPTVAGLAALVMSRLLANNVPRGPELTQRVIAELKIRAKKTDPDCTGCVPKEASTPSCIECLPNTPGPAEWSIDENWYRDHYGVGLAQLTWERFDWASWPRLVKDGVVKVTTSETAKPQDVEPLLFRREWSFGGSYWCTMVSGGKCYGVESWQELMVSLGPSGGNDPTRIFVDSGPSPFGSDQFGAGLWAGFGWHATTNDPGIPVDAESRLRLHAEVSGIVSLSLGVTSEGVRDVCLGSSVTEVCELAELNLTADADGVFELRLGDLFSLAAPSELDSIDFYFGGSSTVKVLSLDVTPYIANP